MEFRRSYITRGYWRSILVAGLCSIILATVIVVMRCDPTLESRWMREKAALLFGVGVSLVNIILFMLLSLTIFLNLFSDVRNRFVLSALSWFVPPAMIVSYMFYLELSAFTVVNTVPYVVTSILTFRTFRKKLSENNLKKQAR